MKIKARLSKSLYLKGLLWGPREGERCVETDVAMESSVTMAGTSGIRHLGFSFVGRC